MYFIYVIESQLNKKRYVGFTNDLKIRLNEHNLGKTKSTKAYKPWEIIYYEEVLTRVEARKREKYLKSAAGRRKIKMIIDI